MNHDVAIVGGGLVGLTLACALGRAGLRVAVVEAREHVPPPRDDAGAPPRGDFDLRVSTITPVSERILRAVGAWQHLPAQRLAAFEHMRVWERAGIGELGFEAADADLPYLGHVVENRELVHALERAAAALGTVRTYRPATLEGIEVGPARVALTLDAARVEARLVAGADGARSRVRDLAGIEARVSPYGQDALVATVRTANGHGDTAWQRFLPDGPLAFLPLADGWCSIVWSTRPEHAAALEHVGEDAFAAELTAAVDARLGEVVEVAGRARFPLTRVQATRYLAPRVALLGDAAHTIHPLAGQGVNLGLLDAAALAEVLEDLHAAGRDLGLEGNLRPYERWRRGHNALTSDAMSGFKWLFGSTLAPVALARNLGFAMTARARPLRRAFVRYASGFAFTLPRLARTGAGDEGEAPAGAA